MNEVKATDPDLGTTIMVGIYKDPESNRLFGVELPFPLSRSIFRSPMAVAIGGGLLGATLLPLLVLPAMYAAWYKVKPKGFLSLGRKDGHAARPEEECGGIMSADLSGNCILDSVGRSMLEEK